MTIPSKGLKMSESAQFAASARGTLDRRGRRNRGALLPAVREALAEMDRIGGGVNALAEERARLTSIAEEQKDRLMERPGVRRFRSESSAAVARVRKKNNNAAAAEVQSRARGSGVGGHGT